MRWSGQQVLDDGVGAESALPGLRGLLRSVRTPEFAGTVFHEVEARSALNRVPGSSPLPFRWTVNPYRGCSHACVYCLAGPTRVLLADGRTRPIADLRVGDAVMGTQRRRRQAGVRAHHRARALVHDQARVPGAAGGRHRARRERRAPVPHRRWVAARDRWLVPGGTEAAAAHRQRAARPRAERSGAGAHPVVPAGLPVRAGARRHGPAATVPVGASRPGGARARAPLPGRHRAARTRALACRGPGAASGALPRAHRAGRRGRALAHRPRRRLVRRVPGRCGRRAGRVGTRGAAARQHRRGDRRPRGGSAAPAGFPLHRGARARRCPWGAPARRPGRVPEVPAHRRPRGRTAPRPLRRARGGRRGAGGHLGATGGRRRADVRHHHRHRRLRRRGRGQPQLLRPQHPHLPRPRRGRRLRQPDRRQGQRRARTGEGAALGPLGARAGGHGHQHRPLPACGGPLPADAGDHRRPGPLRHAVLPAHQGHGAHA